MFVVLGPNLVRKMRGGGNSYYKETIVLNYNNRVPGAAGGVEKERFRQSASTHSGAGENETLNINVIGKHVLYT